MTQIPPPPGTPLLPPPPPGQAAASPGGTVSRDREALTGRLTRKNAGRPRGSRNKRTLAIEALFAGEAETIARRAVELAILGDPVCIRMILDRLAPVPRGRLVEIPDWPTVAKLADVPAAMAHLATCVASGVITADEAADVATIISKFTDAINAVDHELRLAAIEQTLQEQHAPNFRK